MSSQPVRLGWPVVVPYSYPSRGGRPRARRKARGVRSGADARRVRLSDTNHGLELVGREPEAGAHAAEGGVGRGDERISAEVEVEHRGVGALHQHALTSLVFIVDERHGVDDEGKDALGVLLVRLDLGVDVVTMSRSRCRRQRASFWRTLVPDVPDADAVAGRLGRVGGADAALGGADLGAEARRASRRSLVEVGACARSEMTRREESIFTPAFSRVSISLNIPGGDHHAVARRTWPSR